MGNNAHPGRLACDPYRFPAGTVTGLFNPAPPVGRLKHAPHPATRGMTLVEMLVVVAIIGLVVSVSAPSVTAGLASVRMATATDDIATFLNGAVNRAERRQEPIELVILPRENRMIIYSNEPGFERELKLPSGVRLEAVLPREGDEPDGARRLMLLPGASVPGIGIQVVNERGARRIVKLDPMTGFPRVESVSTE
jgi:prepilin-type N-terminal cleavage/methylation domain-containing protein